MHKFMELISQFKDKILLNEVKAVMQPLIDHFRSYLPSEETQDNFDYYMFEALLEVFGANTEQISNHEIVITAKSYLEYFNTRGSSNTIRMAVKFLVFTVKNLRLVHQESIHNHKLPYFFYRIKTDGELKKIHQYISNNAEKDDLAAKFMCPLSNHPIRTPAALRYEINHNVTHPVYSYTLYELSALHDLIFFKTTDINPLTSKYMGSSNLFLKINEINEIFALDIVQLKQRALK